MTFVEYEHHVLAVQFLQRRLVFLRVFQHIRQLLDCGNQYLSIFVGQLLSEHISFCAAVGAVRLKVVVFLHCLIVEVLPVHHKQHLFHSVNLRCELSRLIRCQCLSRAGGMPYISSCLFRSLPSVQYSSPYSQQYALSGCYLIRPHGKQNVVNREHAILGQHIHNHRLFQERLGEVFQVGYYLVVGIRPV